MWQTFVQWFSDFIQLMYQFTVGIGVPSYGLAIIFITIIIKAALFPLTQKQMKSMRGMQEIQPEMRYLQEKYKDQPEIMQRKVMELYKEKGVSPFGGCLPLLIQMPIFIAFYQSLIRFKFAVAEHASFLWIPTLGQPDPYYILAVLAAVTTYLQQRISMVDTQDPTQKTMLYMMPIFMAWITLSMPAGLPLYWVMFNILGILQQLLVNRQNARLATNNNIISLAGNKANEADMISLDKEQALDQDLEAGREKGGNNTNGTETRRKKRKKR